MISQFTFLLLVYLLGLLFTRWVLKAQSPALVVTLAFPIGLAIWVVVACGVLYVNAAYTLTTMLVIMAVLVIALLVLNTRRVGWSGREMPWWAGGSLGFIALAILADRVNCVVLSYDSYKFVQLGRAFGFEGGVTAESWGLLASWGVFQSIVQSVSVFVGLDYIYAVQPLVAVSLFASLFAFSFQGLASIGAPRSVRFIYPALALSLLGSTIIVVYQGFYIHTNLLSAVYLFLYCGLAWLGRAENRDEYVILAICCLAPFTLCRTETPLFALIFLVPLFADEGLSRRVKRGCLVAYTCFVLIWYAKLFAMIGDGSEILTRGKIAMLVLPLAGYTGVMMLPQTSPVEMITRRLPEVMLLLLSLGLLAVVLFRRDHMATSFYAFVYNVVEEGWWSATWLVLIALLVLVYHTPQMPHGNVLVISMPCFLLLLLCLVAARIPYRVGWGDSANRMLTHLVPVVVFYLTVRFGGSTRRGGVSS